MRYAFLSVGLIAAKRSCKAICLGCYSQGQGERVLLSLHF